MKHGLQLNNAASQHICAHGRRGTDACIEPNGGIMKTLLKKMVKAYIAAAAKAGPAIYALY